VIATLIVRKPFTIPYAKEKAPEEVWDLLRGRVHGVLSATRRHQASLAAGETPDEPAPPAIKLVDWLPSRLCPAIDSNV
jgi:hypothetical protein